LQPGQEETAITFALDDLAQSYQAKVLRGSSGVLVDEPFALDVSLVPLFNESEYLTNANARHCRPASDVA